MGMSSSQARLLCLTAKMHDLEYQAQSIQHAKVQLANQSDQVYEDYLAALDATTLTVDAWNTGKITACFNNLFSSNRLETSNGNRYALIDSKGRIVVEDSVYEKYHEFEQEVRSGDPYDFAMYMLGVDPKKLEEAETAAFNTLTNNGENTDHVLVQKRDALIQMAQSAAPAGTTVDTLATAEKVIKENGSAEEKKKFQKAYNEYRYELYKRGAGEIYKVATGESDTYNAEEDFPRDKFDYYADIYKQIKLCGGCVKISDYNGTKSGDAANNSEFLKAMLESGKMTVSSYSVDPVTGEVTMNSTSPSSDSVLSYTQTSTIDKTAANKAEAKYEHDLKKINAKEKQLDMNLTKIETEREALKTEYDSVKNVIKEKIERTFKIFS